MTPDELKTRFRRDVDDIQYDPTDESDLLFTSADVDYYLDEAHRQFVTETQYLHEKLTLYVVAGQPSVGLPDRFIELRDNVGYLVTADKKIREFNHNESGMPESDYGLHVVDNPIFQTETGTPRGFSLDVSSNELHLFPIPDEDDTFQILAFMEPKDVSEVDKFAIKNPRHINMLLAGMKALAYDKQDADAYDPRQAERWREKFEGFISQVQSERMRRRRRPGLVKYGGL